MSVDIRTCCLSLTRIIYSHQSYPFSCQCDITSTCLDANNINEDEDEIRICVISYDEDLLEISFLQITQTDPLGDEVTIQLDLSSFTMFPNDDQSSGGFIVLSKNDLLIPDATSINILGMALLSDSEKLFQLDLQQQPMKVGFASSAMSSEYDEELNLSVRSCMLTHPMLNIYSHASLYTLSS